MSPYWKSRLRRTEHSPSTAGKVWRWGLIALLFLAEVASNSYFLAKGSAYPGERLFCDDALAPEPRVTATS